jgi:thiol-disulfide isomerase/thioredoxin
MKKSIFKILLVLAYVSVASSLFAQKHFVLTVKLPPGIKKENIEAFLEKGKGGRVEKIKNQWTADSALLLKGDYYALYAAITLQYPSSSSIKGFPQTFFIQEKPGKITFYQPVSSNSFINYSLENVVDFKEEKKRLQEYSSVEQNKTTDYYNKHGDSVFYGKDTAIKNYYFNVLQKDFRKKQLEYVVKYPQSYYSFYIFRSDVASSNLINPDSLLVVFNSFPDKFKYSDEGNYLHELILGKVPFKMNAAAIDFVATDINKKRVALSGFKGKKYVLLQFWATWCTPCMKEVNALKEINNRYGPKGLQIISVALKSSSYAEFTKTIKQKGMNWIHIYNDLELYNKYGNQPIPRICLIDINGKLVYDKLGLGDENDFQLKELNRLLEETIK